MERTTIHPDSVDACRSTATMRRAASIMQELHLPMVNEGLRPLLYNLHLSFPSLTHSQNIPCFFRAGGTPSLGPSIQGPRTPIRTPSLHQAKTFVYFAEPAKPNRPSRTGQAGRPSHPARPVFASMFRRMPSISAICSGASGPNSIAFAASSACAAFLMPGIGIVFALRPQIQASAP
jgi:hypothetical protein